MSDPQLILNDNNDLLDINMTTNNNSIHSSQPSTSTVTRIRKNSKKSLSTSSLPPNTTVTATLSNTLAIPMTTQTSNQIYDLNQTDAAINSINSVIENLDNNNKNYSHQILMGANSTINNQDYLYNNINNNNNCHNNYSSNNKYMNDSNQYQSNGYYNQQQYQQQHQHQNQHIEEQNNFINEIPKLNLNYSNQMLVKHHPRPSAVTSFNARLTNQGGGYTLWNRKQDNLRFVLYNAFANPSQASTAPAPDCSSSDYFNQNLILNRSRSFTTMQPPPPPVQSQQDILFQPPLPPPQQQSSIYHQQQQLPKKRTNSNEMYDPNKLIKKYNNNFDNDVDKYLNTAGTSSSSAINETSFINSDIFSSTSYLLNGDDSFINTNHNLPSINNNNNNINNNTEDDFLFNNQNNHYQSMTNKNNHNILTKSSSISLSPSPSSSSSFSSSTSNGNGLLLNGTNNHHQHQQQILSNDNVRF